MHDVGREQSETVRGQVYLTQTSRLMEASLLEVPLRSSRSAGAAALAASSPPGARAAVPADVTPISPGLQVMNGGRGPLRCATATSLTVPRLILVAHARHPTASHGIGHIPDGTPLASASWRTAVVSEADRCAEACADRPDLRCRPRPAGGTACVR
jgi:hypothetical protein